MQTSRNKNIDLREMESGFRPSRFVVDLPKLKEEEIAIKERSDSKRRIIKKIRTINQSIMDKAAEMDLPKKPILKKTDGRTLNSAFASSHNISDQEKIELGFWSKYYRKIERLAFFWPAKYTVKVIMKLLSLFYLISYNTGLLAVFIVRFSWLFSWSILSLSFRAMKLFNKLPRPAQLAAIFLPFLSIFHRVPKLETEKLKIEKTIEKEKTEQEHHQGGPIFKKIGFRGRFSWANIKPALFFSAAITAVVLPFKVYSIYTEYDIDSLRGKVLGVSEEAAGNIAEAAKSASSMDFFAASENFKQASINFTSAEKDINEINDIFLRLAALYPDNNIRLAANVKHILAAGKAAAETGEELTLIFGGLQLAGGADDSSSILSGIGGRARLAADSAKRLEEELSYVKAEDLPEEYQETYIELMAKARILIGSLDELAGFAESMEDLLGFSSDKRYLLVFQNNTELRASGGFIGSYAIVYFKNGKVKNIEVPGGGSYDTEAGLLEKIIAPEPLWLVNPLWHFWDANWWPDWPTTARKLMYFLEKSDGPTVDGVIALTPDVIESVLSVIGPVDMGPEYGVVVSADNFWEVTQTFAEQKQDVTDKPKKIIGDLTTRLMEELPKRLNKELALSLLKNIEDDFDKKQILLYMDDESLQAKAEEMGWDGKMSATSWDYLSVIDTNIAGGKSDRSIKEHIDLVTEVQSDGSIVNTLSITRSHIGSKDDVFSGVRNNDWMRIYVPQGSELLSATGFSRPEEKFFSQPEEGWKQDPDVAAGEGKAKIHESSGTKVYNELGKTVFANWVQVDPGSSVKVVLKYRLPFILKAEENDSLMSKVYNFISPGQKPLLPYALYVQKQPGSSERTIKSRLALAPRFSLNWRYPEKLSTTDNGWLVQDTLETDKYWAIIVNDNQ